MMIIHIIIMTQKMSLLNMNFLLKLFMEPLQTLMSGNDLALAIIMFGASRILPDASPNIMGRGLTIP
jgi:hypothetical protein